MEAKLNAIEIAAGPIDWGLVSSIANETGLGDARGTVPLAVVIGRMTFHLIGMGNFPGYRHVQSWTDWLHFNNVHLTVNDKQFAKAVKSCNKNWEKLLTRKALEFAEKIDADSNMEIEVDKLLPVRSATSTIMETCSDCGTWWIEYCVLSIIRELAIHNHYILNEKVYNLVKGAHARLTTDCGAKSVLNAIWLHAQRSTARLR